MNLDDVLGDAPVPEVSPEDPKETTDVKPEPAKEAESAAAPSAAKESEPAKEAEQAQPRDDKGRFSERKAEPSAPIAALLEERRKRQELEAEVAKYRERQPKTDFFEDPAKATTEHVREQVSPLEREVLDLKVQIQRLQHTDFDEVMKLVLHKAAEDPVLKHQIDTAPDPLSYLYREGKRMKALADVDGDIDKYREKVLSQHAAKTTELETRLKALEAENRTLRESLDKRAKVPQSLNSEPSAASAAETFAGPTPLTSILN